MEFLTVISRIVHVATAIVLVGGSVFTLLVLIPAAKMIPAETEQTLRKAVTSRWKRFVHLGVLLFLISGFYNYYLAFERHDGDGTYHMLMGIKMLLAFGVFFLASALVGRSSALEPIRQNRGRWLTVIVAASLVIVTIAGYLKVMKG